MALGSLDEQGGAIAVRLAGRPADEDPWVSLRHAFEVLDEIEGSPQRRLELLGTLFAHDALRAGHAEKRARWADLLAPIVADRLPDTPSLDAPARPTGCAPSSAPRSRACTSPSRSGWRQEGAIPQQDLLDEAIAAVRDPSS